MPYVLKDLVVDRVDLVDEGANSAAFIELYKRKENSMGFEEIVSKLKPEHAEVVTAELNKAKADLEEANTALTNKSNELDVANEALAKANAELENLKATAQTCESDVDETETLKSMPEAARELFLKMRAQKEAAEEQVRKNAEEKIEAEAIAKAASLKALPIEQEKLVGIIKGCSADVLELLTAANSAIEATVLEEVGKNVGNGAKVTDESAWDKLEKKASEIAERDSITKEKAMAKAVSENPDLYREYLNGGAK